MTRRVHDRDPKPMGTWHRGNPLADKLAVLWDEGLSASQIGLRLGVTKNAVVGGAHRMDLPARPSPIGLGGMAALAALRRRSVRVAPGADTLPPLASVRAPRAAPRKPVIAAPVRVQYVPPPPSLGGLGCQWPSGEVGTKEFRFCDEARQRWDRPYCTAHCAVAYIRVRDLRADRDGVAA